MWKGLNDLRQIRFDEKLLRVEEFNRMHETCIEFIWKSVEESTAAHIVVVTHHLPTPQVVAPHHKGFVLNSAFASEYGNLIAGSRIDAWNYGLRIPISTLGLVASALSATKWDMFLKMNI